MAASSPYSPNDYNALSNFRPYELPINDIFKGIEAQSRFWDAGAERVKRMYDTALNLNLTLDENKQIRKQFLEDAEKELTKLSSMNLADSSVQRQGMKIFSPLFQDDAIMQDDYLTKLQSSIYSDAERYKNDEKTKGEGYHMDNLAYALKDFKGFGRGTSRQAVGSIFDKAKNAEYIPHHNVSKEYLDIAAKCKPDEFSRNTIQGLYFLNKKSESQTSDNLSGCIKSGLSDRGWQQLKITGSVRYGNDYQALGREYQSIIQGNNTAAASRILGLSAEKKKFKDAGQMTPDLEKAYDDEIGSLNANIKDGLVKSARITAGDFSDVEKNYDGIVTQVYANQDVGGFAQAFAYQKESEEYKTNPSAIAEFNQANINARFSQNLQYQGFWKQKEFEQKERENDISLLKAFMDGGNSSSVSGIPGMGGATYQFLKPIMERLGFNPEIPTVLGKAAKIEGVGDTVDTINEKANQYHHERLSIADGIYNTMKQLVGPQGIEALNKAVYNEKGRNIPQVYEVADKYVTDYYKTYDAKKDGPVPEEIRNLEDMLSNYNNKTTQVFDFMRMRDEITSKIDKDPELKKQKEELDAKLTKMVADDKTAITAYDARKGESVIFYPKDLAEMAKGTHPDYKLDGAKILDKRWGTQLTGNVTGVFSGDGDFYVGSPTSTKPFGRLRGERQIAQEGFKTMDLDANVTNSAAMLLRYSENQKDRNKKLAPALDAIVQDVARNSQYYNPANIPGLGNSIRQQFSEFPEYSTPDITYSPTRTFRDNDGDWVTEVQAHRVSKEDGNMKYTPVTDEIISMLGDKSTEYSVNSAFNNIKVINGETLVVKTPYLPMAQNEYPLSETIKNLVFAANKLSISNGDILEQYLKPTGGGFKIGFDIIGGGTDYTGAKNINTYRAWYKTPDGKKELVGMQAPTENDLANQLASLEKHMSQIRQRYTVKDQTKK